MLLADVTRKQAFLTHLAFSTAIFLLLSFVIVFHWYPDFYFSLDGGDRAILTIFFVDVVLGPGLTLLVFKPGKKSLKFDMSVILLLQMVALAWGVQNVYTERPAAAIYYYGKLSCIGQNDIEGMDMESIKAGPSGSQRLAFLQRPDTVDEFFDFSKEAFQNNSAEIFYYIDKIVALDESSVARLSLYEVDMELLEGENPAFAIRTQEYIDNNAGYLDSYVIFPVDCRYGSKLAVYDTTQLKIIDSIDVPTEERATERDPLIKLKITVTKESPAE